MNLRCVEKKRTLGLNWTRQGAQKWGPVRGPEDFIDPLGSAKVWVWVRGTYRHASGRVVSADKGNGEQESVFVQ